MSKLSNSDSRTIRLAREAVSLVIEGALRRLESNFGPDDNPDRSVATDALLLHVREEAESFHTSHEIGDSLEERSDVETELTDQPPVVSAGDRYSVLLGHMRPSEAVELIESLAAGGGADPGSDGRAVIADLKRVAAGL